MTIKKNVKSTSGSGHYTIIDVEDFEYVTPIEQISQMYINQQITMAKDILRIKGFPIDNPLGHSILKKRAKKEWEEKYDELKTLKIPEGLRTILEMKLSKKEQISFLKGLSINDEQLVSFLIMAGDEFNYTYSQYKVEHLPNGFEEKKLPRIAELNDKGEIKSIGNTELTTGQIKQMIKQRHVVVSKFLDRDDQWHCLFLTFKSLLGEENYKAGKPHLHYISSAWGLSRQEILKQLKSKNYKLPSLPHIDFERHSK
jgi:hypothetical protein